MRKQIIVNAPHRLRVSCPSHHLSQTLYIKHPPLGDYRNGKGVQFWLSTNP